MNARAVDWAKLIGAFTVILGASASLKIAELVGDFTIGDPFRSGRDYILPFVIATLGIVGSAFIGVAAWSAHEWARRLLIWLSAVLLAFSLIFACFSVAQTVSVDGRGLPEFNVWWRLRLVGDALRAVSLPAFFIVVLLHRDVVRSFQVPPDRRVI